MCGIRSKALWLSSALLLLASGPSFSQEDGEAACRERLTECVTLLEATTNELERETELRIEWMNFATKQQTTNDNLMILNVDLMSRLADRDERLRETGSLLHELETQIWMTRIKWVAGGFVAGVITGALTTFVLAN